MNPLIRPSRSIRTICIPCSALGYEQVIADPQELREFLERHIQATPGPLSPLIQRGYRLKDDYPSRKTGCKLRRIEPRNLD